MRIDGIQITMEPPSFLAPAEQFSGYVDPEYGTAIMVTEIPGPISEAVKGFDAEGLAKQGVSVLSDGMVQLGDETARLMKLKQNAYGAEFFKWLLVFGDDKTSIIIAASFQSAMGEELSEKLKKTILTARWDRQIDVDFFEGLTFKVEETDSLKFANKMGNAVLMTKGGVFPIADKTAPYTIIATSFSTNHKPDDINHFARSRLKSIKNFTDIKVTNEQELQIANLKGLVLFAEALDSGSKTRKFVHFSILFGEGNYYVIQSVAELDTQAQFKPEFQSLLSSFSEI